MEMDHINYYCPVHGNVSGGGNGNYRTISYTNHQGSTRIFCVQCCMEFLAKNIPEVKQISDVELAIKEGKDASGAVSNEYFQ